MRIITRYTGLDMVERETAVNLSLFQTQTLSSMEQTFLAFPMLVIIKFML
jgi:hypothetical protein